MGDRVDDLGQVALGGDLGHVRGAVERPVERRHRREPRHDPRQRPLAGGLVQPPRLHPHDRGDHGERVHHPVVQLDQQALGLGAGLLSLQLGAALGRDVAEHQRKAPLGRDRAAEHVEPAAHRLGPVLEPGRDAARDGVIGVDPVLFQARHQFAGGPALDVAQAGHLGKDRVGFQEAIVDGPPRFVADHLAQAVSLVERSKE